MRRTALYAVANAALLASPLAMVATAQEQTIKATESPVAQDAGWPRQFETSTHFVRVHQPQVDEWPNFDRIKFRAAVVVQAKGSDEMKFGLLVASARADVSFEDRMVLLTDRKFEQLTFPDTSEAEAQTLSKIVMDAMPAQKAQTVSLDRIIAELNISEAAVRKVEVNLTPPKIYASDTPAVMVVFMGKPRFKAAPGSDLMVAINTNWDVFLDPSSGSYYLLDEESWYTTKTLETGAWTPAKALPEGLSKLPDEANWQDVRASVPGRPAAGPLKIFVATEPSELIVTEGAPELQPLPGTRLMMVMNTENDLFFNGTEKTYYLLAAGRWFSATELAGPWKAASDSLPEDFAKIPEDSDAAAVRASVPGTPEANEAVIMASIPNRATVNVAEVTVNVTYDGTPDFRPIDQTTVKYAYNSPYSVFLVDGAYYCCHNAVWFVSPHPTGAWTVATSVPAAIYTIPPTSPKYNVTYVTVYESTPTTVTTSYTAGYTGAQVAATGAVMFGLGLVVGELLDDDDCWHYHYHSCFFSYGCGARWHGHGGWICAGHRYGPYGGCGGFAAYNPRTGVFSRGAYAYGPRGAAGFRSAYNPSTGVFGYRAGATTPYRSWGSAGISNGDDWVRAGYRSGPRGSVSGIQGSGGGAIGHAEGRFGNGVTVARDRDGDIYAGKDGKVYKRTENGWQSASGPEPKARPATADAPKARPDERYLSDQAASRDRGERNVARSRASTNDRAAPARGRGRR